MLLLEMIKRAHIKGGAPGLVIGCWYDGRYDCQLQYGKKRYRYQMTADGQGVSVDCSWSIAGDKQRKRATYRPD